MKKPLHFVVSTTLLVGGCDALFGEPPMVNEPAPDPPEERINVPPDEEPDPDDGVLDLGVMVRAGVCGAGGPESGSVRVCLLVGRGC